MRSGRFWLPLCSAVGAVALTMAGLATWLAPTREQLAIADLVEAGAQVLLCEAPDGATCYCVNLEPCKDSNEPLCHVPDIGNVRSLELGRVPLNEAGLKHIVRIKKLHELIAYTAALSDDAYAELMRRNPNLKVRDGHRETKPLE